MTRYFVIGTYQRFLHWCRTEDHDPRDPNVLHISRPEQAQGHRITEDDRIVDLGDGDPGVSIVVGMRQDFTVPPATGEQS